jgi:primosomal protein DnaI
MDACSDKEFKEYVYSLNIKEDIMINYTSSLQDAFKENNNCINCSGLSSCKNKLKGYKYTPYQDNNIINFEYAACEREENKIKKDKYLSNISSFEMPKNIQEASFKNIYKDDNLRLPILKYFKEFMANYKKEDKPKGLYLHGSFGSGKTYLIAALFNEMAHKEVQSVLVYYPEFLRSLKSSFNTDYEQKFETIKKAPLLLLDDIGAENETSWSRDEILSPILQYRMEENLPTFFTSNLSLDELEKFFSITSQGVDSIKARRIIERIKQLTIDKELISKNRRV